MPKGKKPLGIPWHKWAYNIKMDLKEICLNGVDWINFAQNGNGQRALNNTIMNILLP
jgi:hypothetical protein